MTHRKIKKIIKNPKKAIFHLGWPILVGMLVQSLYNIVDTVYIGRLGAESIAALTFAFPLFFIFIAINSGIGSGMGSRISRYLGEKNRKAAENTAMHGIILSMVAAIILFIPGWIFLDRIFLLFGAEESVLNLSMDYMRFVLPGIFFMFPAFAISSIFSAEGNTKIPMKVQISGLMLNMILDPIFIYGLDYGVKGAAIATSISFLFTMILFIYYLKHSYVKPKLSSFRPSKRVTMDILKVGMPASIMVLLLSIYIVFINRIMAHFGTDYVAVFGIVSRFENLAIMPGVAFSMSLLTIVGMLYGARRYDLLKSTSWYGIKITVGITCAIGAFLFITSPLMLKIFTNDPGLVALGVKYLRLNVFTLPLIAVTMLVSRVMQGMGMGFPGLAVNLIRLFVVAIPLAYIFVFALGFGYLSVAMAMIIGGLISSILGIAWLERKIHHIIS